jgi:hypothetical protein
MKRLLLPLLALMVCLPLSASAQQDDPEAVRILAQVREQYRNMQTFYATVRQIDVFYGDSWVTQEVRRWEEARKRPNKMRLETFFPQDLELPVEIRFLGEDTEMGESSAADPTRYRLVACDGQECWREELSLVAAQTPVGQGLADTEYMATQPPSALHFMQPGQPWPADPPVDQPITVVDLLDDSRVQERIIPGTLKMVTHEEGGERTSIEDISVMEPGGSGYYSCHHLAFMLNNGLEQHYWVDTQSFVVRAEMVIRVLPPAPDPFLQPEVEVQLPTDLSPETMEKVQRVRRYMTGRFVRTFVYYDHLAWNIEIDDALFTYRPTEHVRVVEGNELFGAMAWVWEITTGTRGRWEPEPPPAGLGGGAPLVPRR